MRKLSRIPAAALVAFLVLAMASPAGAESSSSARRKRDAARARQAALASKINTLKASDAELENAVAALDSRLSMQEARVDAARQSLSVAIGQEQAADARLHDTEAKVAAMKSAVANRAIETYMRPHASLQNMMIGGDLAEASRRAALIDQVAQQDQDVLDQLHATQTDLQSDRDVAAHAHSLADQRRKLEDQSLNALRQARADKQKLQGDLQDRIDEYQREADEVASQEASLSNLIRAKETPRASRSDAPADGNGRVSGAGLIWPAGGPVTSPFGYRWGKLHAGIDIGCGYGTPIHAAKAGTVIFAGQMSGYGNVVVIDHGGGFSTLYGHQSRIAVHDGQDVAQGQVIGYSGNTGHSTGPHLHFETRVSGNPQNPRQYLP